MKKIPYGISNFETLKGGGRFYYVDKTPYIAKLEDLGSQYHFFLRPRRFGKSLLLSTLKSYYDINNKDRFEELFGDTWIGRHPTAMCSSLPVLAFDFSGMQTHGDDREVEASFNEDLREGIKSFFKDYGNIYSFSQEDKERVLSFRMAADIFNSFVKCLEYLGIRFYLFIDEYDNFANNILIHSGEEKYRRITHQSGFFRSFFAAVKKGTATGTVKKLFVTGVSPLVLSDVTSGMNIGDNISFDRIFNGMAGFTREEVEALLAYYMEKGLVPPKDKNRILDIMQDNYDNYSFCENIEARVYNSDMVLSFFNKFLKEGEIPSDLIDANIRTDYGKLRYLLVKNKEPNGNFNILHEIVCRGEIEAELSHSFALDEIIEEDKFISFLYYMGLLSVKEALYGVKMRFMIPNQVIKTMYHDYIRRALSESFDLKIDSRFLSREFDRMAFEGEWKPLFEYILGKLYESASLRDFIAGESGIKMFLIAYLGLTSLYFVESEAEMNKGYADIFLQRNAAISSKTSHEYLIELKFLPSREQRPGKDGKIPFGVVEKLKEAGDAQLKRYEASGKISCELSKIVIVCSAKEVLLLEEVPSLSKI